MTVDEPRIGWWHCLAGASGDMCLGAVVDAGAPLTVLQEAVDAIGVDPVHLTQEAVTRGGLAATKVDVDVAPTSVIRTWGNVRTLLENAELPDRVRATAYDVFERLARAESTAHRVPVDQVHFHEVGALDAIADVVGTAAGLHALGITSMTSSAVAVGHGMTRGEHGLLPIPTPAVLSLFQDANAPIYSGGVPVELCTPTGAAIISATATDWADMPAMRVSAVGVGAGQRDLDEMPNVLRLVVGTAAADVPTESHDSVVVEANVDDLDPRVWPAVLSRLLDAGADDAWLTPIVMKKGRPAQTLSVLCRRAVLDDVRRVMFVETSTIGVRENAVTKRALDRVSRTVSVDGVEIAVKAALLDGVVVNVAPEYDDVARAAAELGRSVKSVLAAAVAAAHAAGIAPGLPG